MVLIRLCTRSSPSAAILAGVSAAANRAGVALLTPASVACADSTTATNNVNGVTYCSSPTGSGLAAWKRRNPSSISALVQGRDSPAAGLRPIAGRWRGLGLLPDARGLRVRATVLPAFLRAVLRTMVPLPWFPYSEPHEPPQQRF